MAVKKILLVGYDASARLMFVKKLDASAETVHLSETWIKDIVSRTVQVSLWEELPPLVVVVDTDAASRDAALADLKPLSFSRTVVVSVADLPAAGVKKMEAAGWEVSKLEKKKKESDGPDTFSMIRAWEAGDRKNAWLLYRDLIDSGAAPEAISGAMLWSCKQPFARAAQPAKRTRALSAARALCIATREARNGGVSMMEGIEKVILKP